MLSSPVLCQTVQPVNNNWQEGINAIIDQVLEMKNGLLFAHIQAKLLLNLFDCPQWIDTNVGNIRIQHQLKQIQDQIATFPQSSIGDETVILKDVKVFMLSTSHTLDDLDRKLHQRWERLGVSA